jgi:transposase
MNNITIYGPIQMRKEFSPRKRYGIVSMHSSGVPRRRVAQFYGVSPQTVSDLVKRARGQDQCTSRPRSGRPRKIDSRDERRIFRMLNDSPFTPIRDIADIPSRRVSNQTIQRVLFDAGLFHVRALRRPRLTETHARERLEFAQKYIGKDIEFWKRWVFLDETSIACNESKKV